ncbi:hypothetical protein HU200_020841 [Digitaria exilis]|uniref:RING-type E3 ubiquitin transferase n=1 Tax=Digitaria exilis TaxID=1010633 RepID=A0A835F0I6_9POAL|nr:hypothetical protein HU200_020841 [Digitaria exilis]
MLAPVVWILHILVMDMKPNNDNTSKGTGDAQEQEESSSRRLKCSIKAEAFCCDVCSKPLKPPIFQCHEGHLFCSRCASDEILEKKCILSSGCTGTIMRSHGMDNAVQSISVDCTHAERGCTEKILYSDSYNHKLFCPHAPCRCPEPSCGFAGTAAELLDHLTTHHKWPSMMFQYWVPFDLRIVKPGTHVLQSKNDGQLFLLNVQSTEPPGLIVSVDSVQYFQSNDWGCSVSFSCSTGHRSTSTLDCVWPWWEFGWPPTDYICFVPKVLDGPGDAGIVLTINISTVTENEDTDDSSYVEYDSDDSSNDDSS